MYLPRSALDHLISNMNIGDLSRSSNHLIDLLRQLGVSALSLTVIEETPKPACRIDGRVNKDEFSIICWISGECEGHFGLPRGEVKVCVSNAMSVSEYQTIVLQWVKEAYGQGSD